MKRAALLASFVLLPVLAASAQAPREMRVTEAIVFKNGLAFLTREGTLTFQKGEARVAPAPDALLGTLWIAAGERRIDSVRASNEVMKVESDATSVAALLDANAGRKVSLLVDEREYTGTLIEAPAAMVLLRIDGKVHAFNRDAVKSIAFAETPSLKAANEESRSVLAIRARGGDGSEPATIRYLRNGVSWIPDYTVELLDGDRARVSMKATLINDGEDLRDARIRFAVGYPSFAFSHVPSPMTVQQTLQQFLATLSTNAYNTDRFANVMTQQIAMNAPTAMDADVVLPGPPAMGESAEDLFFYDRDAVTLAKGERGMFPILSDVVPFRHVYRWTIAERDEVWHSISLTNSGTTPWTTAPALVVSSGKPLAQNTLPYTASGSRAEVKLTLATDVSVERAETEIERKPRDLQRFGYTYDAVVVEGTLTMRNFKRDPITLDVTRTIEGQSTLRDPEAKVTRLALHPKAVNPSERLEWQVPIAAGESRTVKYRYKVWVRE